jgi:hypothetical protein
MPVSTVKRGDKELIIPFIELLILVVEKANKKTGMPVPRSPTIRILSNKFLLICLKAIKRKGEEARKERDKRRSPTSMGVYTINAFLIKI